jgi:ADP-ribose pyrophosphatase
MTIETLNQTICYRAHAFDVAKVRVRLPDGHQRDYDLVDHANSVTVLPVDGEGQMIFVVQHRVGAGGRLLELPAGVLEDGEPPLVCAKRELREEIGMAAQVFKELGGFYLAPGYANEYMTAFLATGLYDAPLDPDQDEFLSLVTMPVAEAYHRAESGGFQDAKTLAALLLARSHLLAEKA